MAKKSLNSLQVLRGLASLAVVSTHSFRAVTVLRPTALLLPVPLILHNHWLVEIGAFGVDIFFVLSGFLMIFISKPYIEKQKPVSDFIAQRFIRIWPLYALVTLLCFVLAFVHAHKVHVADFDAQPLRLLSFAFIPSFNQRGLLQPILGPGWTLNYEILFYICYAAALFTLGKRACVGLAALLILLFTAGFLLPAGSIAHAFLYNSILFEFAFGAFVAVLVTTNRLPPWRAEYWLGAGLVILAISSQWPADAFRALTRGVPATLLFIGMFRLEGKVAWPRLLLLLGDASYSIYLMHILIVGVVANKMLALAVHHGLAAIAAELAAMVALTAGVIGGLLCYQFVEKPVLKGCRRLYERRARKSPLPGAPLLATGEDTSAA